MRISFIISSLPGLLDCKLLKATWELNKKPHFDKDTVRSSLFILKTPCALLLGSKKNRTHWNKHRTENQDRQDHLLQRKKIPHPTLTAPHDLCMANSFTFKAYPGRGSNFMSSIKFDKFSLKTKKSKTKATLEHREPIRWGGPGNGIWKWSVEHVPSYPSSCTQFPGT